MADNSTRSFWTGLGPILAGLAALIGAVTGLVVMMKPGAASDNRHVITPGSSSVIDPVTTSASTIEPTTTIATTTTAPAPVTAPSTTVAEPTTTTMTTTPQLEFVFPVGAVASITRPNGVDACGQPTNYDADNVLDQRRETAWMAPGDGTGASIEVTLNVAAPVAEVGLIPGYDKFDPCTKVDRFFELRRVRRVRWEFDGGVSVEQVFRDHPEYQEVRLSSPVVTQHIRLVILETLPPGNAHLDHTPISEVGVK